MIAARRPGIGQNISLFSSDPLAIDDFNRANGALGTASGGQTWLTESGNPQIVDQKLEFLTTSGGAKIPVSGVTNEISIRVDLYPGSSALGDQAYMSVSLFANNVDAKRYTFEISQRNAFLLRMRADGTTYEEVLESFGTGYTYDTPFRLYFGVKAVQGTTYYTLKKSALDGSGLTILKQWADLSTTPALSGEYISLAANPTQKFDNLYQISNLSPAIDMGAGPFTAGTNVWADTGSVDHILVFTVTADAGASAPAAWSLYHVRVQDTDHLGDTGYRYQKASSGSVADYITREPGNFVLDSGTAMRLGKYAISMKATTLIVYKNGAATGLNTGVSYVTNDDNTFVFLVNATSVVTAEVSAMPLL